MIFYILNHKDSLPSDTIYPCIVLETDQWDDYGHVTQFSLILFNESSQRIDIEAVKILTNDDNITYSTIEPQFEQLPSNYYSLGQSLEYYIKLKEHLPKEYIQVLDSLNDIAFLQDLITGAERVKGFRYSLLRTSQAEKALYQAKKVLENGLDSLDESLSFTYSIQIEGADDVHQVSFDFSETMIEDGFRSYVLIGKNGTGKTRYISNLSNSLYDNSTKGHFEPKRPLFSQIMAISFSLFDEFEKPKKSKLLSYKYIGFTETEKKKVDGIQEKIITKADIEKKIKIAINNVISKDRYEDLAEYLNEVTDSEILNPSEQLFNGEWEKEINDTISRLSSGQNILFFTIAEILADIRKDSILLFDEPETHLHPNAIAKLIKLINKILIDYDSYAIIATHSPIVVQETPRKHIRVFDREGNIPIIKELPLESFGEDLSKITNYLFYRDQVKEVYKEYFDEKIETKSVEEINSFFDNQLSFNALLYLKTIKHIQENE